jgi:hypothetical protein
MEGTFADEVPVTVRLQLHATRPDERRQFHPAFERVEFFFGEAGHAGSGGVVGFSANPRKNASSALFGF